MRRCDTPVTRRCEQHHPPSTDPRTDVAPHDRIDRAHRVTACWDGAPRCRPACTDRTGSSSADPGPAGHFRTSVHASPLFAGALLRADRAGRRRARADPSVRPGRRGRRPGRTAHHPAHGRCPADLGPAGPTGRRRGRPAARRLDPAIGWRPDVPDGMVGLLLATEWLDNVPLDVADLDDAGRLRQGAGRPGHRRESLGGPVDAADLLWLRRWWPRRRAGCEIGWPRDAAWADAVGAGAPRVRARRRLRTPARRPARAAARSPDTGAAGRCRRYRTAPATSPRTWPSTRRRPRPASRTRIVRQREALQSARGRRRPATAGSGPHATRPATCGRWPRRAPPPS